MKVLLGLNMSETFKHPKPHTPSIQHGQLNKVAKPTSLTLTTHRLQNKTSPSPSLISHPSRPHRPPERPLPVDLRPPPPLYNRPALPCLPFSPQNPPPLPPPFPSESSVSACVAHKAHGHYQKPSSALLLGSIPRTSKGGEEEEAETTQTAMGEQEMDAGGAGWLSWRAAAVAVAAWLALHVAARVADALWWRPRRLEAHFAAQGVRGPPYRFLLGSVKEMVGLMAEASSKPMSPPTSHNALPRVLAFYHYWRKIYGAWPLSLPPGSPTSRFRPCVASPSMCPPRPVPFDCSLIFLVASP